MFLLIFEYTSALLIGISFNLYVFYPFDVNALTYVVVNASGPGPIYT